MADKLQQQWSPEQIAGWLKRTYPDDPSCQVSHETIYRTLFIQSRGALKKELLAHLRRTRAIRRWRHHTQKTADHGRISLATDIDDLSAGSWLHPPGGSINFTNKGVPSPCWNLSRPRI